MQCMQVWKQANAGQRTRSCMAGTLSTQAQVRVRIKSILINYSKFGYFSIAKRGVLSFQNGDSLDSVHQT